MKKAFTLVELLVVVVVISILSSIAFRLGGIAGDSSARTTTLNTMQRIENAISGYFAAYGSYPPVSLQGRSRNIYLQVNSSGIQQLDASQNRSKVEWKSVRAACLAQPVAVRFPFPPDMNDHLVKISNVLMNRGQKNMYFDGLSDMGRLSSKQHEPNWTDVQLFQFGLLSYLLPRYLVMMGYGGTSNKLAGKGLYDGFDQWGDNNSMPCRFDDGVQYDNWGQVNDEVTEETTKWRVAAIPSQAITARWLSNFEITSDRGSNGRLGMLIGWANQVPLYGVQISDGTTYGVDNPPPEDEIYSAGDNQSGAGAAKVRPYVLDFLNCPDGWGGDFYYYSPAPYQSYRLWSGGPNKKTFPPWIPDEEINNLSNADEVREWMADDVVHMSN